jgi:hypothetical protein
MKMEEIDKCYMNESDSFINDLYYNSFFDYDKFQSLCFEIISRTKKCEFDIEIFKKLMFINHKLNQIIISHFDQNDLFEIKNSNNNIRILLERFVFLLDSYIDMDFERIKNFEDDLGVFYIIP